jgi:hypothetical protein
MALLWSDKESPQSPSLSRLSLLVPPPEELLPLEDELLEDELGLVEVM